MGSGGPRGLQIPRSGASRVRGGFDSHAFPPLRRLAVLATAVALLRLAAPCAAAAAAPPDSVIHTSPPPDTARAVADTAGTGRPAVRWSEQPRVVMLRSLVVPGWGQWHNRAHVKAVLVAGAEGWLIGNIFADQSAMNRLLGDIHRAQADSDNAAYNAAATSYNNHLDGFIGGQWMVAGVIAYALVDAYVDAHFRTFDIDFRTDPALPRDAEPDPGPTGGAHHAASERLSLRWHF